MHENFSTWLQQQQGRQYDLHDQHINPVFVKMLRTIGFDKGYTRGEGPYLYDPQGNKYLDMLTGWGAMALGRNHPKVKSILQQILEKDLPNLVRMDCSLLAGLVAEKLTSHAGGDLSRVFFTNSGTESVEGAIKFARCFTNRQKIVYCDHSFHGLTTGALAVNGSTFFKERFGDLMPGTEMVGFNDLVGLEKALSTKQVAAFIIEPVQGKTCEVVEDNYLVEAQRLCRKYGSLLILDEVQSGLGRTGKWFCYQHWPQVEPDIVCTSKALSGGYVPVGAILTRPKIMDCVFNSMERCVVHSNTFGQNDLAMAAALATLHVIEEDKLVENAATLGDYINTRLKDIASRCPFVSDVRGKGLMFGLDFARPEQSFKLKMAWDMIHKLNVSVFGQMIILPLLQKHRILAQVAGYHIEVIKFLPTLTVTKEDMDWFLNALDEVLQSTLKFPGSAW
ncbi:MAG TPA: aspartate aminotransferase family protein, partial [Tepidisphaeraceae bacterium]